MGDVKRHIYDSHREMVDLKISSTQISSTQISSIQISSTKNMMANIPSLLMVQPNKANSATLNESPAVETEIEKERKKKVQCQHCSEVINKKYITSHDRKCRFYAKFVENGLVCSICRKHFEKRRDLHHHLGHNHKEIVFLNEKSTENVIPNIPTISMTQPTLTCTLINSALQTKIGKTLSQNIPNPVPNSPSLPIMQPKPANSATQNETPALQTQIGKTVSQNIPNPGPNIPTLSMMPPTSANSATQNISPALQTKIGKIVSQNIPNPIPNPIPSHLIVQPNTANSATQNESPDLETEVEKEAKKK